MTGIGTSEVVATLKAEDYDVTPSYLSYLIRDGLIPSPAKGLAGALCWEDADIARLTSILRRRGRGPMEGVHTNFSGSPPPGAGAHGTAMSQTRPGGGNHDC